MYLIPLFNRKVLQIEYTKFINKYKIKKEKKYVDYLNLIILINYLILVSFSLTNLYILIDKGKAYAIMIKNPKIKL